MSSTKNRVYELIYIVQPEASEEDRNKISDRLQKAIDEYKATAVKKEYWGSRKLAYEIKYQSSMVSKGHYFYFVIDGKPGITQELERILRQFDSVIRFMTIRYDDMEDLNALNKVQAEESAEG
jgi:small subunit ribosomal protein S6